MQPINLPPGYDSACPFGGSKFLVGTGVSYACNGAPGSGGGGSSGFARTVIVGPVGTPLENGNVLLNALSLINPAGSERWLLKIEPGVYELVTPFGMHPGVDVEGSGERSTTILGPVVVADGTELRALRVEWNQESPAAGGAAVQCEGGLLGSSVRQVSIGGTRPFMTGLWCGGASTVRDVTIAVNNFQGFGQVIGIRTGGGGRQGFGQVFPTLIRGVEVTIVSVNGIGLLADTPFAGAGPVQVEGSAIRSYLLQGPSLPVPGTSVMNVGAGPLQIGTSQLVGTAMNNGFGTLQIGTSQLVGGAFNATCVASYNEQFVPLNGQLLPLPSCEPLMMQP